MGKITLLDIKSYSIATEIKRETENNGTDREPYVDTHKYAQLILTKLQKHFSGGRLAYSKIVPRQLDIHRHKNKFQPKFHPICKLNQNRSWA